MNCTTLISPHGFSTRRWLDKVMRYGLCDIAASDAHNTTSRPCRMGRCSDAIADKWDAQNSEGYDVYILGRSGSSYVELIVKDYSTWKWRNGDLLDLIDRYMPELLENNAWEQYRGE